MVTTEDTPNTIHFHFYLSSCLATATTTMGMQGCLVKAAGIRHPCSRRRTYSAERWRTILGARLPR